MTTIALPVLCTGELKNVGTLYFIVSSCFLLCHAFTDILDSGHGKVNA